MVLRRGWRTRRTCVRRCGPSAHADEGISFGGGLSDLSVEDLQTLLGQMSSIKALPSTDPESMTPVIATNEGGKTL